MKYVFIKRKYIIPISFEVPGENKNVIVSKVNGQLSYATSNSVREKQHQSGFTSEANNTPIDLVMLIN